MKNFYFSLCLLEMYFAYSDRKVSHVPFTMNALYLSLPAYIVDACDFEIQYLHVTSQSSFCMK